MTIYLLITTIGDIIVQTIRTKMPICVSYLTNTMPIIGGGGGSHSGNIYADIAQHFCENSRRRVPLLWANK